MLDSPRGRKASTVAAILAALLYAGTASATKVDRDYTLGDGGEPGATANGAVGSVSYDNAGALGAGDLQDLNVSGTPSYRAVSGITGRPGAQSGDLGIEFDGSTDVLFTTVSMNCPTDMWDNETFFPGPPPAGVPLQLRRDRVPRDSALGQADRHWRSSRPRRRHARKRDLHHSRTTPGG